MKKLNPKKNRLPRMVLLAALFLFCLENTSAVSQIRGDDFTFVRIRWTDNNLRYGYGFSTNAPLWAHDWPLAEDNLYVALQAATNIKVSEDRKVLEFGDDEIFDYPFIYACEIGYLVLSKDEVANLREYLLRGGFLMVDDFRWLFEWRNWLNEIRKVLPDATLRQLRDDHVIFHCFFDVRDIHERTPYLREPPQYWGLFDEHDRMMVLINFNNDVGDGWELPQSTPDFSTMSFKLGINYLIYSYTH